MKRILVRSPNWIGDQVLAYPFFLRLRELHPDAWIAVVCTEWVKDIQFRYLVDEVFVLPKSKRDSFFTSFKNIIQFSKTLRSRGPWDLSYVLPNSFGAALMMFQAKVKERVGYNTDMRGMLLTKKPEFNSSPSLHRAQSYLNLLDDGSSRGSGRNLVSEMLVSYPFDPIKYWPEVTPLNPPKDQYFIISPGSNAESRRWSIESFSELIVLLLKNYPMKAVVVGGRAEKELAIQMFRKGIPIIDYTAQGSVAEHWKLFKNAAFSVCNDSGLAHVSALCGCPTQVIFGAADPRRTSPLSLVKTQIKVNAVECWPCDRNQCQFQDGRKNQCLNGITPSQILMEVQHGLYGE